MRSSVTRRQLLVDGGKVVVATSALGTLLEACGGGGTTGGTTQSTLQYWNLGYQPNGANATGKLTDAAIAGYSKAHANTKVVVTGYTGDQAGFTKVTQAVRGGSAVDLFRLPSDELPLLVQQGLIAPVDDFLTAADKADIYPSFLDAVKFNGKSYAWPLWVPPVGMYINLDVFKERGVEAPKDDWTYEQFVDMAKHLTFTRANGEKVYGYTSFVDPGSVNSWPIIMGDGATPLNQNNTKYTFNTPEGISGLQKLVDLALKDKVTPPDFGTQSSDVILSGFQNKRYAMYSAPSGDSSTLKKARVNFDVKAMPIGGAGKPVTTGGIGLISVTNISDHGRLKAAMDLGRYLTGAQVAQDVPGYYLAPGARKSVTVNNPISKFTPFVTYAYIMPIIAQWSQVRTILHTQIQNAILGKTSAKDAFTHPADEINSILPQG